MFRRAVGDGIEIRLLELRHAGEIFTAVERNRQHLRRFLPWVDLTWSADDIGAFLMKALAAFAAGEEMHAGIWIAGELRGAVGHHRIDATHRSVSIGYWLDAAVEGKGVMTRCCRALLEYLFEERELHRVEIRCATENTRSCAIPARLGFTREGVLREAEWVNDRYLDLVVWSLLEPEWRKTGGGSA